MNRLLIFGLSGQIGDALLPFLKSSQYEVTAVSRQQKGIEKNIRWVKAGFSDFVSTEKNYDAIISLGPLDAFSLWLASADIVAGKIIALSSTSITTKENSNDADERKLSRLLFDSEQRLRTHVADRESALVILRPTLVYGVGRDQSISRWLAMAKRIKFVILPISAGGLRQPVHVSDVAAAIFRALQLAGQTDLTLDLPGGEVLAFDRMLLRSLEAHAPGTKVLRIPDFLFRLMLWFASFTRYGRGLGQGFFARLSQDWVFDLAPARKALDFQPRPFSP